MKIYCDYKNVAIHGTVVTIGNFDGFHLGHRKILATTKAMARDLTLPTLVMTFQPHPRRFFQKELPLLTPLGQKLSLLQKAAASIAVIQPFTKAFADTPPTKFLEEVVIKALKCRQIVVGYDYSFGSAGAGGTELIKEVSAAWGVGCRIIEPVRIDGNIVSSSVIRSCLADGDVTQARHYLGRPHMIMGKVTKGQGRGHKMGFPTANIYPSSAFAEPKPGVYLVRVDLRNQSYWGLANLGSQPTFNGKQKALEVFLIGFCGNLYGKYLKVNFFHRLRDERMFPEPKSLIAQLKQDVELAKTLLACDDMLNL